MASIFLKMLLILLCIILSIIALILFIPFKYILTGKIKHSYEGNIEIICIFGLIKINIFKEGEKSEFNINIFNINIYRKQLVKKISDKKQKMKENRFKLRNIGKELLIELFNYVKDIFNIIKPEEFKITGIVGFDDPFLTGILLGVISILKEAVPKAQINLKPAFNSEIIDIEAKIYGKVRVYIILYKTIKFLMKKEIRKKLFKKQKTI